MLDCAIIFAPVGALVPAALRAIRKGGRVVCAGIHMSDIPSFPYRLLWEERQIASVANLTRRDATEFFAVVPKVGILTDALRREVDRLFDEFSWRSPFGRAAFDLEPFWRGELTWGKSPAVDIVDKGSAFEITAELPGLDPSNIDVKFSDGTLSISGEKKRNARKRRTIATFLNGAMARFNAHSSSRTE